MMASCHGLSTALVPAAKPASHNRAMASTAAVSADGAVPFAAATAAFTC